MADSETKRFVGYGTNGCLVRWGASTGFRVMSHGKVAASKRVLIVEDELMIRMLLEGMLTDLGHSVAAEAGGLDEAISLAKQADFDLAVLDVNLNGTPVTPDDVVFSFESIKKHSPLSAAKYRQVAKAERTGDREVKFTIEGSGNRTLPQAIGELVILPKAWWQGTDQSGKARDIGASVKDGYLVFQRGTQGGDQNVRIHAATSPFF